MKDVSVKAGQNFKLSAKFSGFPLPTATWSKGDTELSPTDRIKIRGNEKETELTQLDSEREDSGVYSLTCENPFGKETATCNVTVLGKLLKIDNCYSSSSSFFSSSPPSRRCGCTSSSYWSCSFFHSLLC